MVIKVRRLRVAGHMGDMKTLKRRGYLADLGVDGKTIVKRILNSGGLYLCGSGKGPVAVPCEHGN
jgi:hypothetical protein